MQRFQWLATEEAQAAIHDSAERSLVADELADADYNSVVGVIYCLSLSNLLDLDTSSVVLRKLKTNEHRDTADEFRGRFRRPEREREDDG